MFAKKYSFALAFVFLSTVIFGVGANALGAIPDSGNPTLVFSATQTYVLLIGALVPLATYVINHYAPWVSEPAKALFMLVVSATAAGLYQALDVGQIGFNSETLQIILSAIMASLTAHKFLYAPAEINRLLKAGTNVQDKSTKK